MKKNCYVYLLLDTRKQGKYKYGNLIFGHQPFYVGKGSKNILYSWYNRFSDHLKYARQSKDKWYNSYKCRVINKIFKVGLKPIFLKIKENITMDEAFNLEKELILTIGRHPGPLTNLTNGGDGGMLGYKFTNEQRKTISKRQKGNRNSFYGKHHSKRSRQKISEFQLGKKNGHYNIGEKNPMYGTHRTGDSNPNAKVVIINGIKYSCIKYAANILGICRDTITNRIKRGAFGYEYEGKGQGAVA